ncbi:MAG: type II toxin-antitoxin system HicB family antitoxin [Eubacteriales bacterium]
MSGVGKLKQRECNILEYKGYYSKVEFSVEDGVLFGKIEGIVDLITFESDNICEIVTEFESAVDEYLLLCAEMGKEPNKVYKGSFNVRIAPSTHRRIAKEAYKNNISLNQWIEEALNFTLSCQK